MRQSWIGLAIATVVAAAVVLPAAALAATKPPGYTVVKGPMLPVPASTGDTSTTVGCPLGTVVWGGGAGFFTFPGSLLTVNTTAPFGAGMWTAHVGNLTGMLQQFQVDAVCAKKPTGYRIVTKTVDSPGVTQATATATCPAKTVVLGGGVTSTSTSAATHVLSDWAPKHTTFRAILWNGTGDDQMMTVSAICGKQPPGYIITRESGTVPPAGLDFAGGVCPASTSVLSGGFKVSAANPGVRLDTSLPDGPQDWDIDFNNRGTTDVQLTTSAICAA
jgi:hypothetical protein